MGAVIAVVKPFLIQLASHPAVKNLVIELLERYVNSTDNTIDNLVVAMIKERLYTPMPEGE